MEIVIATSYQRARSYCEVDREPRCSVRDPQVRVVLSADRLRGLRLGPDDKVTWVGDWGREGGRYLDMADHVRYLEASRLSA